MPPSKTVRIQSEDQNYEICTCGRFKDPAHCIFCGSSFVYGRSSRAKKIQFYNDVLQQIEQHIIRNFFCRRCSRDFFEDQPCVAPPPRKKDKMRVAGVDESGRKLPQMFDTTQAMSLIEKLAAQTGRVNLDIAKKSLAGEKPVVSDEFTLDGQARQALNEQAQPSEPIPIRGSAAGEYKDPLLEEMSDAEILEGILGETDDKKVD